MKKTLLFLLLCLLCVEADAQKDMRFYDIRGNRVSIPGNVQPVIICYHTGCCHNCMNILVSYAQDLVQKYPNLQLCVLVPEGDVGSMRFLTSGLKDYFDKESAPTILYDLDPVDSLRYMKRFKMQQYPCMIVFDAMQQCHYFSYDALWGNNDSLNADSIKSLIDKGTARRKRTQK